MSESTNYPQRLPLGCLVGDYERLVTTLAQLHILAFACLILHQVILSTLSL